MMADYVAMFKQEDALQVCFYNEDAKIMAIGDKMNAIREEVYMNGYNWEAFPLLFPHKSASLTPVRRGFLFGRMRSEHITPGASGVAFGTYWKTALPETCFFVERPL